MVNHTIKGRKGGGSSPRTPVEQPDDLQSIAKAKILLALGEGEFAGELTPQSIFLDGTPLKNADGSDNFSGVVYEFRAGTQAQHYIQGMPSAENEISVGLNISSNTPWNHTITNTQLSAVRIRLKWPSLFRQEDNGDMVGNEVKYAIDLQTDGGTWKTVVNTSVKGKSMSGYERSHRIDLPQSSQTWALRLRKISPDANSAKIGDALILQSYTEVIDAKLRYPHTALLYIEFDSKQFNGSIPQITSEPKMRVIRVPTNYDPETRHYSGNWDGSFKWAWTDNPAWVFYDVVTGDRFGLGNRITQVNIDKWSLYQIAQYCDQLVPDGKGGSGTEPRYTCNVYVQDRNEAYIVLRDFAAIFRGMTYWGGDQLVALADMPRDIDYSYTRANVIDGKFVYSSSTTKNRYTTALVSYSDPFNGYADAMEPVFESELVQRYNFNQLEMTAIGCIRQSEANRKGRWGILTNNKDRAVTFSVGLDGNIPQPGYIIAIADELLSGRATGGRIHAVNGRSITLDRKPHAAIGDRLMLNLPSGISQARTIQSINKNTLTVTVKYDEDPQAESVWVVESDELYAQQYRVISVADNNDATFTISAVSHDPDKYARIDTGAIIDKRPISVIPPGNQSPPNNIVVNSYSVINQGINIETLQAQWEEVENAISYESQWRRDDGNWINVPRSSTTSFEVPNIYSGRYLVRVRAINAAEISSGWGYSKEITLTGKVGNPPIPINFRTSTLVFGIKIDWDFGPYTSDTLKTEIQYSKTDNGENLMLLADVPYPSRSHEMAGLAAGVAFYFRARLVDKSGNESEWTPFVRGVAEFDASSIIDEVGEGLKETETIKQLNNEINYLNEAVLIAGTANVELSRDLLVRDGENKAGIKELWRVRATDNEAWAQSITEIYAQVGENKSGIIENKQSIVTLDKAFSQSEQRVQAQFKEQQAIIDTKATTMFEQNGNGYATHSINVGVKVDGVEHRAGMVIGAEVKNGAVSTLIGFSAQQFAFYNPVNGKMELFVYAKNGQLFIREAFIDEAWIKSLVVTDKMVSDNFVSGKSGFSIDAKTGNVEFNKATFRGTIDGADGRFTGTVYAERLIGDIATAGTYPEVSAHYVHGGAGGWQRIKSSIIYAGGMPYEIDLVFPVIETVYSGSSSSLQERDLYLVVDGISRPVHTQTAIVTIPAGKKNVLIELQFNVRHKSGATIKIFEGAILACKHSSSSFKKVN